MGAGEANDERALNVPLKCRYGTSSSVRTSRRLSSRAEKMSVSQCHHAGSLLAALPPHSRLVILTTCPLLKPKYLATGSLI